MLLFAFVGFFLPQAEYYVMGESEIITESKNTRLSLGTMANETTNHSSTTITGSDPQSYSSSCPIIVPLSSNQSENNVKDIQCIEKEISQCRPTNFSFLYGTGSIKVIIHENEGANKCSISVDHETEGGVTRLDCDLPTGKVVWNNWKKGYAFSAINDLFPYCSRRQ